LYFGPFVLADADTPSDDEVIGIHKTGILKLVERLSEIVGVWSGSLI
jgi:hypothetical protein